MKYIPIIGSIFLVVLLIRVFRIHILRWLLKLRARLQIRSLRTAIEDADTDKADTGRKNMVVFNTASGKFEPLTKKLLKTAEKAGKNKSNAQQTAYRKKYKQGRKKILGEDVKTIEKKSLYVTN